MTLPAFTKGFLKAVHAFGTRVGGRSGGPYESLNCGFRVGDDPSLVNANREALVSAAGGDTSLPLVTCRQVHSVTILNVASGNTADLESYTGREADALVTAVPGVKVGVLTADCLPLLLSSSSGTAVAAVHCGWRGAVGGLAAKTARFLIDEFGVDVNTLHAAIGPCISFAAFEVGPEVIEAATACEGYYDELQRPGPGDRRHLDLKGLVRANLQTVGLDPANISVDPGCSYSESERYFSYRRLNPSGRMLSFVECAK